MLETFVAALCSLAIVLALQAWASAREKRRQRDNLHRVSQIR